MRTILLLLLLLPQLAFARVYMCVDEQTGKTSFTDKACATAASGEEVRLNRVNVDSGRNMAASSQRKTWNSERDRRKTGVDYNADRRELHQASATAQSK